MSPRFGVLGDIRRIVADVLSSAGPRGPSDETAPLPDLHQYFGLAGLHLQLYIPVLNSVDLHYARYQDSGCIGSGRRHVDQVQQRVETNLDSALDAAPGADRARMMRASAAPALDRQGVRAKKLINGRGCRRSDAGRFDRPQPVLDTLQEFSPCFPPIGLRSSDPPDLDWNERRAARHPVQVHQEHTTFPFRNLVARAKANPAAAEIEQNAVLVFSLARSPPDQRQQAGARVHLESLMTAPLGTKPHGFL